MQIAQTETPPASRWDRLKAGAHDRGEALKGRVEQSIENRLDQYQPQIATLGAAYCVGQRTDLYYGIAAGSFVGGVMLTLIGVLLVKRLRG